MKVYFRPLLRGGNPYMSELVAALHTQGVEVCGVAHSRRLFLPEVLARRIDVVHLHWLWGITTPSRAKSVVRLAVFLLQLVAARILGVKIVFTAHNLKPHESPHPGIDLFCTKKVIELSHRTIVHGDSAKRVLERELRLGDRAVQKMVTILHGHYAASYPHDKTREQARRELEIAASDFVFVNLGMIRPYKGILDLIDAFKQTDGDGLKLLIAGRPLNQVFQDTIERRIDGDPRIRFSPGFVADEDVQTFIEASDVMVFPFEDVLSSGSVILGLSFGRTCVCPDTGCMRDILSEDDAYLYSPTDPSGLLEALRRAVADRDCALERGARGRSRALEWTWQVVGCRTAAVYREACKAP